MGRLWQNLRFLMGFFKDRWQHHDERSVYAFLVRACLLLLTPEQCHLTLAKFYHGIQPAENLDIGMKGFLSLNDQVGAFYGSVYPGRLAALKRFCTRLWDRVPEPAKFWLSVRAGMSSTVYKIWLIFKF